MSTTETATSAAPTGRATIDANRYTSVDYMAREWNNVWPRTWLFAGLVQDVQEPGEYFVFSIGTESILVACDDDGAIGAFFNVCQHRGARVMVNDRGWVKNFVCPYHGWTYATDGALDVVPERERFSGGVPCEERSLPKIRVETWAGMVWVCMDPGAPELLDFLGPLPDLLAPYRLGDMRLTADQTVHLDANWKAVVDNFGELYHVEHIHPQHAQIFDCPTGKVTLFEGGHTAVDIIGFTVNSQLPIPELPTRHMSAQMVALGMDPQAYRGRVLDVRKDVQQVRREKGPELGYNYDLLTDEQLSDIVQYNIFPNLIVTVQPEDLLLMRARPHPTDPNKCFWDKLTLRMPVAAEAQEMANLSFSTRENVEVDLDARPEHDEFDQDDIIAGRKSMTITIDQDVHLIRDVQAGMRSRGFNTALLSDEEGRVQHFHDWLDYYMS